MFAVMRFSFSTIASTSTEKGHKVLLGPEEFRRWGWEQSSVHTRTKLSCAARGQKAGKTDVGVYCGFDGLWGLNEIIPAKRRTEEPRP